MELFQHAYLLVRGTEEQRPASATRIRRELPFRVLDDADSPDDCLHWWLLLNHTSRLIYSPYLSRFYEGATPLVWRHRSFIGAMYHFLFMERLAGTATIRRCPECGRYFVPKRDAVYDRERCSNTVSQRRRRQVKQAGGGPPITASEE